MIKITKDGLTRGIIMEAFDFGLLENDLIELEHNLRKYGSKPVKDEISLNQLFIDHLALSLIHI